MGSKPMSFKILAVMLVIATLMSGCATATTTVAVPTTAPATAAPTQAPPTAAPTADQAATLAVLKTQVVQTVIANLTLTVPAATAIPPKPTAVPAIPTTVPAVPTTVPAVPTSTPAAPAVVPTATLPAVAYTPYLTPTNSAYNCQLLSSSPKLSDKIAVSTTFVATWKVSNTGSEGWASSDVDIRYLSGKKMQVDGDLFDLDHTVSPSGAITINLNMKTPALAGVYVASWAIMKGNLSICSLNLNVTVVP